MRVANDAMLALKRRSWPGNVRELKNALACALAFVEASLIELCQLVHASEGQDALRPEIGFLGKTLESIEREAIVQRLHVTRGKKAQAAESLGIAVSTLYEKLKKYKVHET
ncbi:MAG: zraR 6 [Polyangiaceae bacterium]|nr:zraR 6 [Polyangiaceae bacterium]